MTFTSWAELLSLYLVFAWPRGKQSIFQVPRGYSYTIPRPRGYSYTIPRPRGIIPCGKDDDKPKPDFDNERASLREQRRRIFSH